MIHVLTAHGRVHERTGWESDFGESRQRGDDHDRWVTAFVNNAFEGGSMPRLQAVLLARYLWRERPNMRPLDPGEVASIFVNRRADLLDAASLAR